MMQCIQTPLAAANIEILLRHLNVSSLVNKILFCNYWNSGGGERSERIQVLAGIYFSTYRAVVFYGPRPRPNQT
jgi:hypothetical protein